mgnify:CR=1 FL=1
MHVTGGCRLRFEQATQTETESVYSAPIHVFPGLIVVDLWFVASRLK